MAENEYKVRHSGITPFQDIDAIQEILRTDPVIIGDTHSGGLGFDPQKILRYDMADEEISNTEQYIFISTMTGEKSDGVFVGMVYSIQAVAHKDKFVYVGKLMERLPQILQYRDIGNNHELELLDPPVKVSTTNETIMYATTFLCYSTI